MSMDREFYKKLDRVEKATEKLREFKTETGKKEFREAMEVVEKARKAIEREKGKLETLD
ncbi:MAG: hypothetical protein MUP58_01120 [Candidatus Nanohaloarchaeota archaeon QJJ-9]|nr:hypothetical protein [Candidatus Nanohaloarchaeota archaeon QJJ-9]